MRGTIERRVDWGTHCSLLIRAVSSRGAARLLVRQEPSPSSGHPSASYRTCLGNQQRVPSSSSSDLDGLGLGLREGRRPAAEALFESAAAGAVTNGSSKGAYSLKASARARAACTAGSPKQPLLSGHTSRVCMSASSAHCTFCRPFERARLEMESSLRSLRRISPMER